MPARLKKETRPKTKPVPIRFTEAMMKEIEEVSSDLDMSNQDVIRLAVSAGIKALKKVGHEGIRDYLSRHVDLSGNP